MADKNSKCGKNVAGKYYVDTNCISCGQCGALAPDYFKEDAESGLFYVYQQPTTPEGIQNCKEAKDGCPVEAIGDDA